MTNEITFEGAKLKREADSNEMLQLISFYCADRERNAAITDINQMKNILVRNGEKIELDDYYKAWKKLEDLGVGSIIQGRNGKSTRFKWNYSLKAIGQAAMSGKDIKVLPIVSIKRGKQVLHKFPIDKTRLAQVVNSSKIVEESVKEQKEVETNNVVYIQLRPDYTFEANFPKLSEQEAEAICKAVRRCV